MWWTALVVLYVFGLVPVLSRPVYRDLRRKAIERRYDHIVYKGAKVWRGRLGWLPELSQTEILTQALAEFDRDERISTARKALAVAHFAPVYFLAKAVLGWITANPTKPDVQLRIERDLATAELARFEAEMEAERKAKFDSLG